MFRGELHISSTSAACMSTQNLPQLETKKKQKHKINTRFCLEQSCTMMQCNYDPKAFSLYQPTTRIVVTTTTTQLHL